MYKNIDKNRYIGYLIGDNQRISHYNSNGL